MGRTWRLRRRKTTRIVNVSNDPVYLQLHSWLKSHGFSCQPPLKPAVFPDTGRGLQASTNIEEGEVLVTIPVNALITRDLVLHTTLPCNSLQQISDLSTQTLLSVWLLSESSKGSSSPYHPYLQSLPQAYTTPYFCTSAEQLLLPSYLQSAVADQHQTVVSNYTSLVSRGFKTSLASFEWAWFTVNTRAVYLSRDPRFGKQKSLNEVEDSGECLALAPYLDLLNHSVEAVMSAGVDIHKSTSGYQIVTKTRIKKYTQAFINYGPHGNTKLLLEYGFFLPSNPHEGFQLTIADLIQFLEISGRKVSGKFQKVDILKSNRLDQNLSITSEGLSWNTVMCLKVFLMTKDELNLWHLIFQQDEGHEDDHLKSNISNLVSFFQSKISATIGKMSEVSGNCSDSFSLCYDLVKSHARILQQAKLSI